MPFDVELLQSDLIRDEGLRLKPYVDTVGKWTIGVGRNLTDRGISEREARYLLANDIVACANDLDRAFPWWTALSEPRQRALMNMAFNMGLPKLKGFTRMLASLEHGDYETAASECLSSKWATQVGQRAGRIAGMIREG